jgi:CRISPR system Cascade subunit CasC
MFLQVHTLTSFPASLLNRDDAGLAKRIPFGNAPRLRVSSQCLKRHWRTELAHRLPHHHDGLRTRSFFTRAVLPKLVSAGIAEDRATALVQALAKNVIDGGVQENAELSQPVLFGLCEADYFVTLVREVNADASTTEAAVKALGARLKSADEKKNIRAMRKSAGLTGALFGRFVTSDLLARVDAPVHVAHAFTVHAANSEMDYFTVVDDLSRDEETGAAHANQAEIGAGIYYGYVAVDVPLLVSNITGAERSAWANEDKAATSEILATLIDVITTVSPGAKLGSTAPYSCAEAVLLEAGTQQPRTLANAFLSAVRVNDDRNSPMQESIDRMGRYLAGVDRMYGATASKRGLATIHDASAFAPLEPAALGEISREVIGALWE